MNTTDELDPNDPNDDKDSWTRLKEFFQSTNWDFVLAGVFCVIHFIWLLLIVLPEDKTYNNEDFIITVQTTFNSLGFLLIGKENAVPGASSLPIFTLAFAQFLMSCLLLWGVQSKSLRRIDQWLLFSVWSAFLNALNVLNDISTLSESESLWTWSRIVVRTVFFYIFNGFFIWRMTEFRNWILVAGDVSVTEIRGRICCCCGNKQCFKITAAVFVAIFTVSIIVSYSSVFHRPPENLTEMIFMLVLSCVGLVVSILLFLANSKDNRTGIHVWLAFQIGLCGLWYCVLVRRIAIRKGTFENGAILANFLLMSPLLALIWISHVRLQEIKYSAPVVYNCRSSIAGGVSSVYIPSQDVTLNIVT